MAETVISRADADHRLAPGGTVVEYTGGSTGTSLAFVCAATGHRLQIVTSDAFSQEKRDHMAALGAERMGAEARVVTLMADTGLKYLSTNVYRQA